MCIRNINQFTKIRKETKFTIGHQSVINQLSISYQLVINRAGDLLIPN